MFDVAVIGAGPTGSRVALKLAEMGRSVVVTDKKTSLLEPVCCTGIISLECVDRFEIDKRVIIRHLPSATIYSPSGVALHLKTPEPLACVVDRPHLNLSLARQAQAKGAEYALGIAITDITVRDDRVILGYDESKTIEARAVVIAAGSNARLAEKIGLGEVGDFAMGVQAVVETTGLDETEVFIGRKTTPGMFAWLVPTIPGKALAGLLARKRAGYYMKTLLVRLTEEKKIRSNEVKLSFSLVPLNVAAKTYARRVISVGSAAGQVKPTTGGGIYYGLLCADIASASLNDALEKDDLSSRSLSAYEKTWKKSLGREIQTAYWARKLFEKLSDRQMDNIIEIMNSRLVAEAMMESPDLSFDWHGKMVFNLVRHKALSGVFKKIKFPSNTRSV